MRVSATLAFDLETERGSPITERDEYVYASEAVADAIRSRLLGAGFLDDVLIRSHEISVTIIEDEPPDPTADKLMEANGGYWSEYPRYTVRYWQRQVANHETRLGYWEWVAVQLIAEQLP